MKQHMQLPRKMHVIAVIGSEATNTCSDFMESVYMMCQMLMPTDIIFKKKVQEKSKSALCNDRK